MSHVTSTTDEILTNSLAPLALLSGEAPRSELQRRLDGAVRDFVDLDAHFPNEDPSSLCLVASRMHALAHSIARCSAAGFEEEVLGRDLAPAREVFQKSPFGARIQSWPRGYAGDFETIEYICDARNLATAGSLAAAIEQYMLTCAAAQQHRNKVRHQADRIIAAAFGSPGAHVLSLGCGGCRDIRAALGVLCHTNVRFTLEDVDQGALDFALPRLSPLRETPRTLACNVVDFIRARHLQQEFDLVVAGGLFDYLPDRTLVFVLRGIYGRLLRPGGKLFFTNMAAGNPYAAWIGHLGSWRLTERTEQEIRTLCERAGIPTESVTITRDETGLALLVDVAYRS